jgi:hypothetical protein
MSIDVLKVLDDEITSLPQVVSLAMSGATISDIDEPVSRLKAARSAVAELIEATDELILISEMACGLGMFGGGIPANADGPLPRAIAALRSVKGGEG